MDFFPRERLLARGPRSLSDVELIALVLGTGSAGEPVVDLARRLIDDAGGLVPLADLEPSELAGHRGVGLAKAARLSAAAELGRRLAAQPWEPGQVFRGSLQVFSHFHGWLRDERQELFVAVYLDARNRLIGEREISRGSLVASLVHPREVFRPAIRLAAASVIGVHNHPSGDPRHSQEDVAITQRLMATGDTIGIPLLDHVIIGNGAYLSFADRRLVPFDARSPRLQVRAGEVQAGEESPGKGPFR